MNGKTKAISGLSDQEFNDASPENEDIEGTTIDETEETLSSSLLKKDKEAKTKTFWDLCKNPEVRKNSLIAGLFYFNNGFIWWVSLFGVQVLKGNIYFNSTIGAIADLIGGFLTSPILNRFKRRSIFIVAYVIVIFLSIGFYLVKIPDTCISDPSDYCW